MTDPREPAPPAPTRIIWRRTGKEHGEDRFQVNSAAVIDAHLRTKAERLAAIVDQRRWWYLNDQVLFERPLTSAFFKPTSRIFYLPQRRLVAIADIGSPSGYFWYVHVGDVAWDARYDCWVFTDLFADVLLSRDLIRVRVEDLDDLANALRLGLIDGEQAASVLDATQRLLDDIAGSRFPYPELCAAARLMHRAGDSDPCRLRP